MDDPNYISPKVRDQTQELASRLVDQESDEDVYWRATEISGVLTCGLPHDTPERLYLVWAWLEDIWELEPKRRPEAATLMRDAANEFLSITDYTTELDGFLSRWSSRLGADSKGIRRHG